MKRPYILTEYEKACVKSLFEKGYGAPSIASHLRLPAGGVLRAFKEMGLYRDNKTAMKVRAARLGFRK